MRQKNRPVGNTGNDQGLDPDIIFECAKCEKFYRKNFFLSFLRKKCDIFRLGLWEGLPSSRINLQPFRENIQPLKLDVS
jgi:hypothetical protein